MITGIKLSKTQSNIIKLMRDGFVLEICHGWAGNNWCWLRKEKTDPIKSRMSVIDILKRKGMIEVNHPSVMHDSLNITYILTERGRTFELDD